MKNVAFILMGIGCSILVLVCGMFMLKKPPKSFWNLIGVDERKQYEVYICYQDIEVILDEGYTDRLVVSLENMSLKGEKTEAHEYTPSDYQLFFEQDGQRYTAQFYWFSGREALSWLGHEYKYPDRRVDVEVNGRIYTFYQSDEFFWNEDISKWAFDSSVKEIDIDGRYEIDGYDFESKIPHDTITVDGQGMDGLNYSEKTIQEILDEADQVVVARCEGLVENENGERYDAFTVEDVLKGDVVIGEKRQISRWMYGSHVQRATGKSYIIYAPVYLPEYKEDELYLLCLNENVIEFKHNKITTHSITSGMFGSGIVDNDIVYPRYNTEYHPFFNISLDNVKQLCTN